MNCQEFEQIVADLAADKSSSARSRVAAMAHAAGCEHCDARLAAENKLSLKLAGFAESTGREQASPQLRQSLRAAFEAQQTKATVNSVEPAATWMEKAKALLSWQTNWGWSLAAAAVVLVVVGSIWWQQQAQNPSKIVAVATSSPTVTPSPKAIEPLPEPATNLASQQQAEEKKTVKRLVSPRHRQTAQAGQNDLASNFIPLSSAAGSATPDESLVVRVDVPRTTLIAMGLPLYAERGHEIVKADLRVGMDGVPLAIRLVRQ